MKVGFTYDLRSWYLDRGYSMEDTAEFDIHLSHIGELYQKSGDYEKARDAYVMYLNKFKNDYKVWTALADCYQALGDEKEAKKAHTKARDIRGQGKI